MNETWIEQNAEAWLLKFLESLGGWPLMNSSLELGLNGSDLLFEFIRLRQSLIFDLTLYPNPKEPLKFNITLSQPSNYLSKAYYLGEKVMNAYKSYLIKMAEYLGVSASTNPDYKKDIEDVVNLEIEFSKVKHSTTLFIFFLPKIVSLLIFSFLALVVSGRAA